MSLTDQAGTSRRDTEDLPQDVRRAAVERLVFDACWNEEIREKYHNLRSPRPRGPARAEGEVMHCQSLWGRIAESSGGGPLPAPGAHCLPGMPSGR